MKKGFSLVLIILLLLSCKKEKDTKASGLNNRSLSSKPNIILLYVDDLGYADVGCYGAVGVKTPNIDELANEGVKFTDAHSSAATCTPSRYSLLTGNYSFRNNASILDGNAALIIDTTFVTLPKILQSAGYATAVIGKWHLGLGEGDINWNEHITPGPKEVGFDYSFLLPASGDRVPTVFVENGNVANLSENDTITVSYTQRIGNRPTGFENQNLLKVKADGQHSQSIINGVSRIGFMAGGQNAEWIDEDFPFIFNRKAADFINKNKDRPFFLFYSFHDIHVPRLPHQEFKGKSAMGARGDAIAQVDYVVGEIRQYLKDAGVSDNTLIVFTSDNGPVLNDGYEDKSIELLGQHSPSGKYKGGKYSAFEAGTRVPTIVHWPDHAKAKESYAMMSQIDLYASLANLVGEDLEERIIDSENHLDAWLGNKIEGRKVLIEESFTLSIREGDWKYIRPIAENKAISKWIETKKGIASGLSKAPQLYNLKEDPKEDNNLAEIYPEIVKTLEQKLSEIELKGR